jgi:ornithine carbamoyltransferase
MTGGGLSAPGSLRGRDVVGAADLSPAEIRRVFETAALLKAEFAATRRHAQLPLAGRTIAMLFERPSLRTRVTFEAGMAQLGGHAVALTPGGVGWGARETVGDVAANLDNFVDGLVIRTGPHEIVAEFAERARIPVVNALTLREHPCQALADVFTIREVFGDVAGRSIAFIGDGNNVFHSLAIVAAGEGAEIRLAHPAGYGANPRLIETAIERAAEGGGRLVFTSDPREAVAGADVVYTDAWTSMGQEAEAGERRLAFEPYRVDEALMAAAGPDARVMHCLPAHRGEEITSEVLDGPRSIVLRQSENRLHVQKALLVELLGDGP